MQSQPLLEGTEGLLFGILVVILFFPPFMERLRIPGLIGLILGGYLLGPTGFNLVDSSQLKGLGSIGLLYLMFLAGLELDLGLFSRNRNSAIRFGLLTFTFPFVLGVLSGKIIGLSGWALLLIGSVWASHTLVTYPIIQRHGLISSRSVVVSVGATVITDTLALLVLAVVSSASGGGSAAKSLLTLGVGLASLFIFTLILLPRLASFWFRGHGRARASRYLFVFLAFIAAALLAELFGLEGIVGAFFAGLGLNRSVPNGSPLMEKVEFVGNSLFIPFFLISIGLLIDPKVIFQLRTLQIAAAFAGAVIIGKAIAAFIGGRLGGFAWAEIGLMFSLTIPQAAATLAAAAVGLQLGLFDTVVLNAVLVVVLVTLLVGSAVTELFSRRIPAAALTTRPLGEYVVVGVTEPDQTDELVPFACALARSDAGTVNPLHVVADELAPDPAAEEVMLESMDTAVAAAGAEGDAAIRLSPSVAIGLRNAALESHASMLVVGNRRRNGLDGLFRDRAVEDIVGASPVPVVVLVEPPRVHRIVVPVNDELAAPNARANRELLSELVLRLRGQWHCSVLTVTTESFSDDDLAGLSDTKVHHVKQEPTTWLRDHLEPGDLIVSVSGNGIAVIDSVYNRLAQAEGIGLAIVAGAGQAGTGFSPQVPTVFVED